MQVDTIAAFSLLALLACWLQKRAVILRDDSNRSIELTMWGKFANQPGDQIFQVGGHLLSTLLPLSGQHSARWCAWAAQAAEVRQPVYFVKRLHCAADPFCVHFMTSHPVLSPCLRARPYICVTALHPRRWRCTSLPAL